MRPVEPQKSEVSRTGGRVPFWEELYHFGYEQVYYLGLQTARYFRKAIRFIGKWLALALRFLLVFVRIAVVAVNRYGLRTLRLFQEEIRHVKREAQSAKAKIKAHEGKTAALELWRYMKKGVGRHKKMLSDLLLNFCLPVAAVLVLYFSVSYWNQLTIALKIDYKGQTLGYVTDESVYNSALKLAETRIVGNTAALSLNAAPTYTIRPVKASSLIDAATLSEKLIGTTSGQVEQACGVYVDGKFVCAVKNETDVVSLLDNYLAGNSSGKAGERVEFLQTITRVQGMYPAEHIWGIERIWEKFNSKSEVPMEYKVRQGDTVESISSRYGITVAALKELNPSLGETLYAGASLQVPSNKKFLQVQVTRTEVFQESLPYETVEVKNASRYQGYRQVKVKGEQGVQQVTAMVTYVDGVETKRNEISRVTVKDPVTKKIEVGTKSTSLSSGLGGSYSVTPTAGRFVWPVVGLRTVNSPFAYRWGRQHKGIDISGGSAYGRLILAADSGTVEYSGYHYSYGNYVVIDHGGGVKTLYAHASYLGVSTGQHVTQGQAIARVGSTGNSTGPHLHFSVIINGTFVDPAPYLGL